MKTTLLLFFLTLFALPLAAPTALQAQPITTGTLVREMADMERLTRFPEPTYKTVQFSSYDRRSNLPGGPGWYANSDGFGGEPIPNVEEVLEEAGSDGVGTYLLCDVEGPGAIVRTWTANMNGQIRLYLDGAEEPLYDGPANTFLRQTWYPFLEEAELDTSLFEGTFVQRDAGYFPIPFAERLRVEWTGKLEELHFYEIQVRRYESGTAVETFSPEDMQTYRSAIEETAAVLADPDAAYTYASEYDARSFSETIPAGESRALARLEGPGAIARLTLQIEADSLERALRQSVLNIAFDGHPWAQVQSPVGDFFGAAPGVNPYQSLPFTVQGDGRMTSRFVMPFADSAQVMVRNRGDEPVTVTGSVLPMDYAWDGERSMHFRARWRVDQEIDQTAPFDMPYVLAHGKGLYVGTTSILMNPSPIPSAGGNWWGEGDEKIFVDDDEQPSTFGTGSEDYYNYSWSASDIFYTPYAGQPRNDGPGTRGFVTNYRWHVLDPLPFSERIGFYMELFRHRYEPGLHYARTSYYYARPGVTDDHMPLSDADVRLPALNRWNPVAQGGAREATFYQAEELVVGEQPGTRLKRGNLWAEGTLFVWEPEADSDSIALRFTVPEAGTYRLAFTLAKNNQSGVFSVSLDGRPLALRSRKPGTEPQTRVDLYAPYREVLRNYRAEPMQLDEGEHTLLLRSEGAGGGSGRSIGFDFLWVQPPR